VRCCCGGCFWEIDDCEEGGSEQATSSCSAR
jgi:hypothetical protein